MGYSTSIKTVQRNMDILTPLIHKTTHIYTHQQFPHKLAYKIRESLRIATRHPDVYPELAALASRIRVRVVGATVVVDRPEDFQTLNFQPYHEGEQPPLITYNIQSVESIVGLWISRHPSTTPIVIQHSQLSTDQLKQLARWAAKQTPLLMVLSAPTQGTVTLAVDDPAAPIESRILP